MTCQVLYIAGAGRSGSTLLEMVLGNFPEAFSVGEVRFFWEYWQENGRRCGCGSLLRECDFWNAIVQRLHFHNLDLVEMGLLAQKHDRTRNVPWFFMPFKTPYLPPHKLLDGTHKLYDAIWQESGKKLIVDSSKVPSHLFILSQLSNVDVRTLHLVRDGRAVAYSWNKRQKQELGLQQKNGYMPHHSLTRALITWLVENSFTDKIGQKFNAYTMVRYEDLTKNIATIMERTFQELALPIAIPLTSNQNTVSVQPTHSVGGNPLRFEKRMMHISLDEEWRQKIPHWQQVALWLLGMPLMRRYGFTIRQKPIHE